MLCKIQLIQITWKKKKNNNPPKNNNKTNKPKDNNVFAMALIFLTEIDWKLIKYSNNGLQ